MKKYFVLDDKEIMKKKIIKENVKKFTILFSLLLFFSKLLRKIRRNKKKNCFEPKCMLFDSQLCICAFLFFYIIVHVVEYLRVKLYI